LEVSRLLIFEDADLDSAVEGLGGRDLVEQGRCCAGSRLLMQESIGGAAAGEGASAHEYLARGSAARQGVDVGPSVARVQLERIQRLVEQGIAEGATCGSHRDGLPSRGFTFPDVT